MTPIASKFWEAASSGIAQKWLDRLLSPALIFWISAATAYAHSREVNLIQRFLLLPQLDQGTVIVGALAVVTATAAGAELAGFRVLRYLEGYWPAWLGALSRPLVQRKTNTVEKFESRWAELKSKYPNLTPEETTEYSAVDRQRGRYPRDRKLIMPTGLGNIMRASETYAQRRYGLAAGLFWPRLWLLVSEEVREQVRQAQRLLMGRVQVVVLAAAFCGFVVWTWWAPVVGLIVAWLAYRSVVAAAVPFGDLLRAVFDLHHRSLVKAITGREPEGEHPMRRSSGEALTLFIRRGSRG